MPHATLSLRWHVVNIARSCIYIYWHTNLSQRRMWCSPMLLQYPNGKLNLGFFLVSTSLKCRFFGWNMPFTDICNLYAKLYRMKFAFIQAVVSVNNLRHFGPTMTSSELLFSKFPTQLGYYKTLSLGKLACHNAHAVKLVCLAEISSPAWRQK